MTVDCNKPLSSTTKFGRNFRSFKKIIISELFVEPLLPFCVFWANFFVPRHQAVTANQQMLRYTRVILMW